MSELISLPKNVWEDITSYSKDNKARTPNAWSFEATEGVTVIVVWSRFGFWKWVIREPGVIVLEREMPDLRRDQEEEAKTRAVAEALEILRRRASMYKTAVAYVAQLLPTPSKTDRVLSTRTTQNLQKED